jgi:hypothetical protein
MQENLVFTSFGKDGSDFSKPDRMIFVTGGSGFLGSYILQELVLQGRPGTSHAQETIFPFHLHLHPDKIGWREICLTLTG